MIVLRCPVLLSAVEVLPDMPEMLFSGRRAAVQQFGRSSAWEPQLKRIRLQQEPHFDSVRLMASPEPGVMDGPQQLETEDASSRHLQLARLAHDFRLPTGLLNSRQFLGASAYHSPLEEFEATLAPIVAESRGNVAFWATWKTSSLFTQEEFQAELCQCGRAYRA